eukprot:6188305-Pleurochrysis_carterae.AAC.2
MLIVEDTSRRLLDLYVYEQGRVSAGSMCEATYRNNARLVLEGARRHARTSMYGARVHACSRAAVHTLCDIKQDMLPGAYSSQAASSCFSRARRACRARGLLRSASGASGQAATAARAAARPAPSSRVLPLASVQPLARACLYARVLTRLRPRLSSRVDTLVWTRSCPFRAPRP